MGKREKEKDRDRKRYEVVPQARMSFECDFAAHSTLTQIVFITR